MKRRFSGYQVVGLAGAVEDVRRFHRACGVPDRSVPGLPDRRTRDLRWSLIIEELTEYARAEHAGDVPAVADALADVVYVVIGTALAWGIPLEQVWRAVQASNMAKILPDGRVLRRAEDGKILKPHGWESPARAICEALERCGWQP